LLSSLFYFDIHTHRGNKDGVSSITQIVQDVHSVGLHPWNIPNVDNTEILQDDAVMKEFVDGLMNRVINILNNDENKLIKAIGECGLDKLCTAPLKVQVEVFKRHVELSQNYRLPLIIHCVKAMDEMLKIKKLFSNNSLQTNSSSPTPLWIWHGFRGKSQQLQQLLRAGFYVSFGSNYNKESLCVCPKERMFLETDDADVTIESVYEQVANDLCITKEQLADGIASNFVLL